jgi:hypothetical protein
MLFVVPMHYLVQDDTCNPLPGFVPTYKTVGYEQSAGCRLYPEVEQMLSRELRPAIVTSCRSCDGVMCDVSCSPVCLDWVFPVPRARPCVDVSVSLCACLPAGAPSRQF